MVFSSIIIVLSSPDYGRIVHVVMPSGSPKVTAAATSVILQSTPTRPFRPSPGRRPIPAEWWVTPKFDISRLWDVERYHLRSCFSLSYQSFRHSVLRFFDILSTRFVGLYRYTHETFEICLVLISAYIVIFKHAVHVHWIRGEGKSIFWYLPTFIFGVIVPLLLVWEEDTTSVIWDNCSQSLENITPHLHLLQQPSRISNVFFFSARR